MDKKKFGLFIKETRLKKGYTQKDLADLLYLDVTAVSKWERGVSYPDITLIPDLCKYLDVTEKELIESSQDSDYRELKSESRRYHKIVNTFFLIPTILYIVAIITCFIVNLCVSKNLSWFFIVLASCLTGFTFIPTITKFFQRFKLLVFIASTFISLFLLYLTCSIYSSNYWFMIASIGTLLGYVVIFYPILFNKQKEYLNEKYDNLKRYFLLTYFGLMMILTIILLVFINIYSNFNLLLGILITIYCYSFVLVIGLVNIFKSEYLNKYIKAAIDLGVIGIIILIGESILDSDFYPVDLLDWKMCTTGNVIFIILIVYIIIFISMIVFGILDIKKNRKEN